MLTVNVRIFVTCPCDGPSSATPTRATVIIGQRPSVRQLVGAAVQDAISPCTTCDDCQCPEGCRGCYNSGNDSQSDGASAMDEKKLEGDLDVEALTLSPSSPATSCGCSLPISSRPACCKIPEIDGIAIQGINRSASRNEQSSSRPEGSCCGACRGVDQTWDRGDAPGTSKAWRTALGGQGTRTRGMCICVCGPTGMIVRLRTLFPSDTN